MDNNSNHNGNNNPQAFFNFVNNETNKLLQSLNSEQTGQVFQQFQQQWLELTQKHMRDPSLWLNTLIDFQTKQMALWNQMLSQQVPEPSLNSNELSAQSAQGIQQQIFDYIKKSYVVTATTLSELAENAELAPQEKQKLAFYTRQYIEAMSPDNFAATNPEVIQEAIESNGQSLVNGLQNLMCDIEKGRISMTDENAFTLGENIATTEGQVIYQNELFQLIHYRPHGNKANAIPTVIVPPCINKFYILDLQPHNSFVNFCVQEQQNTFLISWVNPTAEQGHLSWDAYTEDGIIKAFNIVKSITGSEQVNAVAWCVGGTLLSGALAVLAKRQQDIVKSATFLTTLVDFEDPGDIAVFIDKPQVEHLLYNAKQQGVLSGRHLATAFNMLRSRDLIWSYVVNNYLKGKQPAPFDILYWNGDSTNLPYDMYQFYLRQMYLENNLSKANALTICGESINLADIKVPCYFLSTIADHIAPWQSTYKGAQLFGGTVDFVLGASGHVAGVINPASKNRRNFWTNNSIAQNADNWFNSAQEQAGSWWPHWQQWLQQHAGKKVVVSYPGNSEFQPIETAPGSYVKVKLDDMPSPTLTTKVISYQLKAA